MAHDQHVKVRTATATGMSKPTLRDFVAKTLTTKSRNALDKTDFAMPETRSYPIHDLSHAQNALARASGKPEESKVKAAVYKKWPQLQPRGK